MSLVSTLAPAGQLNGLRFQRTFNTNYARAGDPYFGNVSLLLHMDGANGSTAFIDSSSNVLTATTNGDAQISTAQSKFGGASAYFDGTGDFLTVPANSGFVFNGDFTIECWAYFISVSSNKGIIASSSQRFGLIRLETRLYWIGSPDIDGPSQTLTTNTWTHIACSRQGSTLRLFVNGNLAGSGTTTETPNLSSWYIANDSFGQINNVYIDDLRVTKGIARYASSFTPPAVPFLDYGKALI